MAKRKKKFQFTAFGKLFSGVFHAGLRMIPIILIAGAVLLIFSGIRHMLYADPYFQVGKVVVFPSGVLNEAEYQYLEKETRGRNLLAIDLKQISKNLAKNTQIKRAEVQRQFPNVLKIFLVTRNPLFQVQLRKGGAYYLVGGDQVILSEHREPRPEYMVIEDYGGDKKSYSLGVLYQNQYFNRIAEILDWIKTDILWSREAIKSVSIDSLGNFTFLLSDGIELRIGKGPLSGAKRLALEKLIKSSDRKTILYLDMRYQDIIVKKRS